MHGYLSYYFLIPLLHFGYSVVAADGLYGSTCAVPIVPTAQLVTPQKTTGTWYGYLSRRGSGLAIPRYNEVLTYTGQGQTVLPGSITSAEAVMEEIYYFAGANGTDCKAKWAEKYFTIIGTQFGIGMTSDTPSPKFEATFTLYQDYDTLEILYQCAKPNYITTRCDDPHIFVNSRKRPDQMSGADKEYTLQIINAVLDPYCLSHKRLTAVIWDSKRETCTVPHPAFFDDLVNGVKATLTA
ncbi:uncharacterized protein LOC129600457 isoform X2 [Paramacrobiotus metropolitanus]|uniref:uncharacterized protein LOC129600457 isoform X2 n=1 Tax=Paramacrobiotus metropolitanus TaxID=2943436 RepID=UPI002445D8AD|nr:uncharacterized protein LOC129600457 isoform X2 [Paramacrobiotus metropolitanus]